MSDISRRGASLASRKPSFYYKGWEEVTHNEYHPSLNPGGCIQLGLADNKLSYEILQNKLDSLPAIPLHDYAGYADNNGLPIFREALASLMSFVLSPPSPLLPSDIFICSGATSMLEMLAWCLADPGDVFILPSPYYPGFDVDIASRSGVEIFPARSPDFEISLDALEAAVDAAVESGKRVRAVLISSPSNPLGGTFSTQCLRDVIQFCRQKNVHLISDEIYAGSVHSAPKFVSVLSLIDEESEPFVHVVYGLAKDFGIPGFRMGVCHTRNIKLQASLSFISRFYAASTQTQATMAAVLSDRPFVESYLEENNRRLRDRSLMVVEYLKDSGVSCWRSNAGLFVWADFRKWLPTNDFEGEATLFEDLLYNVKVNVTPGQSCQCIEPGWFRLCFACVDEPTLLTALERLKRFSLNLHKSRKPKNLSS